MSEKLDPNIPEVNTAMADFARSIAAVAQAGLENDQGDMSALELPAETLERAADIYTGRADS
jgi:hypothetical protein